jgi:diguanylate cyclase (GGDEF)-like protein
MAVAPGRAATTDNDLRQRLNALSAEFGGTLAARVTEIRRIWDLVPAAPSPEEAISALGRIHDIVHVLAGAGRSFGFGDVSTAAAPLDGLFRLLTETRAPLTSEELAQIEALIQNLEEAISRPPESIDVAALRESNPNAASEYTILLLGAPTDNETGELQDSLVRFGLHAKVVTGTEDIPPDIFQGGAGIVYADVSETDGHLALLQRVPALSRLPLILASSRTGFGERLQAVHGGASLFLAKPFELAELIDVVTTFEDARFEPPFRVVVAEDDAALAMFYQLTLEHAGMEARIVRQPSKMLDAMSGFDPDLILMDLYMPECSGLDLAQIIRQFPAYTTVPILFLSTESRLDIQLRARRMGADDFLPKPLQPGQLVSAVTSRASRYRELKKLTDRDSLTGLLNHANILRCLEREMSVANRARQPVAFAMIDIDHFKRVNDTYGHAVGDQVILRVTRFFRNRLRRVDYIGRYGGEEFAVVMPNTDAAEARRVVDQIRLAVAEIEHGADHDPFRITFSAGIASYPTHTTPADITQAADAALYQAKRDGRNQVLVAGGAGPTAMSWASAS